MCLKSAQKGLILERWHARQIQNGWCKWLIHIDFSLANARAKVPITNSCGFGRSAESYQPSYPQPLWATLVVTLRTFLVLSVAG